MTSTMPIVFLKNIIRSLAGSTIHSRQSFSQEGEDLVIDRLLEGKRNGFYVEVGCHHPFRFSNTYFFYLRGWRGVCIDPLPGTKALFSQKRPRDIAIEKGVSLLKGKMKYFMFNEPALNTFDENIAQERDGLKGYKINKTVEIETDSLGAILNENSAPETIDFLSVDVEGMDLQVLRSNDWKKFRPKIIVAETLQSELNNICNDPVSEFLHELGYKPYAKTGCSVIFIETEK